MEPTVSQSTNWLPFAALAVFLILVIVALWRMGFVEAAFKALGLEINLKTSRREGQKTEISVEGVKDHSEVRVAGRDYGLSGSEEESNPMPNEPLTGETSIRVSGIERSKVDAAGRDLRN